MVVTIAVVNVILVTILIVALAIRIFKEKQKRDEERQAEKERQEIATEFTKDNVQYVDEYSEQMSRSKTLSDYYDSRDELIDVLNELAIAEKYVDNHPMKLLPSVALEQFNENCEAQTNSAIQRAYENVKSTIRNNVYNCVTHKYSGVFMQDVESCSERMSDGNKKFAFKCFEELQQKENEAFYDTVNKAERLRTLMRASSFASTYLYQRNELVGILKGLANIENIVDPFPMKPLPSEILKQLSGDENIDISRAIQNMYESLCLSMMSYPQDDQLTMSDMQDYRLMRNDEHDYKLIECAKKNTFSKLFAQDIQLCQKETVISQENLKLSSGYVKNLERLEREILRLGESHVSNITSELRKINERLSAVSGKIEETDGMEGHVFEYWCADLLEKSGFYDVEVTQGSGDQGVDITAVKDEVHYAIQCKCYSSDIGNKPIQEVYAGKEMYQCQVGAVMTNSYFTSGAKQLAEKTRVLLWDRDKLSKMLEKVTPEVENDVTAAESFSTSAKAIDLDSIEDLLQRETTVAPTPKNIDKVVDYKDDLVDITEMAIEAVLEIGYASTPFLQRRLKLGYARAARTMDELESMGIVGPADGAKPRQVLMTKAQWLERRAMIGAGAGGAGGAGAPTDSSEGE